MENKLASELRNKNLNNFNQQLIETISCLKTGEEDAKILKKLEKIKEKGVVSHHDERRHQFTKATEETKILEENVDGIMGVIKRGEELKTKTQIKESELTQLRDQTTTSTAQLRKEVDGLKGELTHLELREEELAEQIKKWRKRKG